MCQRGLRGTAGDLSYAGAWLDSGRIHLDLLYTLAWATLPIYLGLGPAPPCASSGWVLFFIRTT